MAALSREQITKLAQDAGWKANSQDLSTAVAIAYAESSGDPRKYNGKGKDNSYGLWQINMIGKLGPDRRKQFGLTSNDQLFDPATNARVAHEIYKKQGFQPWTTYTSGEYLNHMDDTTTEEGGNKPGGVLDKINPLSGVDGAINGLGANLLKGVTSITGVIVAVALLALGVVILVRNVVPVGKVFNKVVK